MFHHQMKHLEVRPKYTAACRIFNSLLSISSGDETLRLILDILHQTRQCLALIHRPEKTADALVFHRNDV